MDERWMSLDLMNFGCHMDMDALKMVFGYPLDLVPRNPLWRNT